MIHVVAAIIEKDTKVLLAKRKAGKHLAGFWEFPGGKVKDNESVQDCLKREIKEELCVDVRIKTLVKEIIFTDAYGTIKLIAYSVSIEDGVIELKEHEEIVWVNKMNLLEYDLAPVAISVAKEYIRRKII